MKALELAKKLLENPNAEVKLSISDTKSALCVAQELKDENIEIEDVRGEEIVYLNIDHPIS